ncbi:Msa family membrane protein [Dolosigranulum savutiense]|uniref:Msa family membrane protein n=1 Tax=Dolosigranulum savutiense TaxID=3110288 RepID=A0AB74THI5_9LACT
MKKFLSSVVAMTIIFGITSLMNVSLPLVMLILLIYIIPLITNIFLNIFFEGISQIIDAFILSIITTVGYVVFSVIFMNLPGFNHYLDQYNYQSDEMFFEIEQNFIALPQLLFVFILNFSILYLVDFIVEKRKK